MAEMKTDAIIHDAVAQAIQHPARVQLPREAEQKFLFHFRPVNLAQLLPRPFLRAAQERQHAQHGSRIVQGRFLARESFVHVPESVQS